MTQTLTRDGFLGGRLHIAQPKSGYRAGVDPVFLAAATPAEPHQTVLDLGCGVGTAALCLAARVRRLDLWGLEVQKGYAALAETNAISAGIPMTVVEGDVHEMPPALRGRSFDHVMMNPPYFQTKNRTVARDRGRENALAGPASLAAWCDAGLKRLKVGGWLTVIHVPECLPTLLSALNGRAAIRINPLAPREGRDATRIIVRAQKGGRGPASLAAPTVVHAGSGHGTDADDDYSSAARAVLRDAAPWPWNNR